MTSPVFAEYLGVLTTSDPCVFPCRSIDSDGNHIDGDSAWVHTWHEDVGDNTYTYAARGSDMTMAWIAEFTYGGGSPVKKYYFRDAAGDIDNDQGDGMYTGCVTIFAEGEPFETYFSFYLSASNINTVFDYIDVAVSSRLAPTTASRTLDVTATGAAGIDWANVENQTNANAFALTTIGTVTNITNDVGIDAGSVDDIWDELQSGHTTAGTFGKFLDDEITSRLAPTTEGRTLDVTALGNAGIDWANIENSSSVQNMTGTTIGVCQNAILAAGSIDAIWNELTSGHSTVGSFGKLLVDQLDATITSRSSHAAADVWTVGTRELTHLDEDNTTMDLDNTIALGVWDADTSNAAWNGDDTRFGYWNAQRQIGSGTGATAAEVWSYGTRELTALDEDNTTFDWDGTTIGTATSVTNDVGITATAVDDIWDEGVAGHDGADTYGDIIHDNLNATVSSRSSHAQADVWAVATRELTHLDEDNTTIDFDATTIGTATNLTTNNDKTGYTLTSGDHDLIGVAVWDVDTANVAWNGDDTKFGYWGASAQIGTGTGATAAEVWSYGTRELTALDEDNTTFDWDGTTIGTATSVTNDVGITATAVDDIWDEATSGHTGVGTFGKLFNDNINATIGSRSSHAAADVWAAATRELTALDEDNTTLDLDGTTIGTATTVTNAVTLTAATIDDIWDELTAAHSVVGSFGKLFVDNINATISSRSSHSDDDVWSVATRTLTAIDEDVTTLDFDATTVGDVTNPVDVADKTGFALSSAGVDAIWDESVAGHDGADTYGDIVHDNLNATVSSRSSHAAADIWTVGTRALTDKDDFTLTSADHDLIAFAVWDLDTNNVAWNGDDEKFGYWGASAQQGTGGGGGGATAQEIWEYGGRRLTNFDEDIFAAESLDVTIWETADVSGCAGGDGGIKALTICVKDSSQEPDMAIPGAEVSFRSSDGLTSYGQKTTEADGCNEWTSTKNTEYSALVSEFGYVFQETLFTLDDDDDPQTITILGYPHDPGSPGSASQTRVFGWIYGANNSAYEGAEITFTLGVPFSHRDTIPEVISTGVTINATVLYDTTDADGAWDIDAWFTDDINIPNCWWQYQARDTLGNIIPGHDMQIRPVTGDGASVNIKDL